MAKSLPLQCLTAILGVCIAVSMPAQQDDSAKNAEQARAALDLMVKALGGDAWLQMQNREYIGRSAGFYHGKPSGATVEYWEYHAWPDHDRAEFTKHRDVVQILPGARVGRSSTPARSRCLRSRWTTTCADATTRLRR